MKIHTCFKNSFTKFSWRKSVLCVIICVESDKFINRQAKNGTYFIDTDIDEYFSNDDPSNYPLAKSGLVMQKFKKHAIVFKIGCSLDEKNRFADGSYLVWAENQDVVRINAFLDHLIKLDKLRIDGSIDNEDFELLVNKRLADIPDA